MAAGVDPVASYLAGTKDFIAAFEDAAFELDFACIKILRKQIILCNSPETIQYAFSIRNDNFERKSSTIATHARAADRRRIIHQRG